MAELSKREQVVEYVVGELEELREAGTLGHVTRTMPELATLRAIAATQFPAVAVSAGLPVQVAHKEHRQGGMLTDVYTAELAVAMFVFDSINEGVDTRVSFLADELWAKLLADQLKGGLCIACTVAFDPAVVYLRPFISFNLTATCVYQHDTGGI